MSRLIDSFLSVIYALLLLSGKRVETKNIQTNPVQNGDGLDSYTRKPIQPRDLSHHHNDNAVTWLEAFRECGVSSAGHLASPINPPSHESLRTYMISTGIEDMNIWIGAKVSEPDENNERVWYWDTYNLSVLWRNFHLEPSACSNAEEGQCLSAYTDSETAEFAWCGRPCGQNLTFICEFGIPPEPTTTTTSITTPTTDAMESTTEIIESIATEIKESTTEIIEPTTKITESTTEIMEPSTEIIEKTTEITESTTEIIKSTTEIMEPSTTAAPTTSITPTTETMESTTSGARNRTLICIEILWTFIFSAILFAMK